VTWGTSITGKTTGGLTLTLANSSDSGAVAQSIVMGNAQSNALTGLKINLGTSDQAHEAIRITQNESNGSIGLSWGVSTKVNNTNGTVYGIYQGWLDCGGGTTYGIYQDSLNSNSSGTGYGLYQRILNGSGGGTTYGIYQGQLGYGMYGNAIGWYVGNISNSSGNLGKYFSLNNEQDCNELSNRTLDASEILFSRKEERTSGTTADNFNILNIKRTSIMNGAGGTFTAAGSVMKLENVATQTAGTLTDTTVVLNLQQGAVTSTNVRRVALFNTITLWVSDGTSPNEVLSGNAGDICFGADGGKVYYCGGTTTWTSM
jgi:hypothetical protein